MKKKVFSMYAGLVDQDLVGMAQSVADELGVKDGDIVSVKTEHNVAINLRVRVVSPTPSCGGWCELRPEGVCLDKKTRKKLGVRALEPQDQKPDFVEIEKL